MPYWPFSGGLLLRFPFSVFASTSRDKNGWSSEIRVWRQILRFILCRKDVKCEELGDHSCMEGLNSIYAEIYF